MSQAYSTSVQIQSWLDVNNVHHELLPFSHRQIDPIEVLRTLREDVNGWPETKATFTLEQTGIDSFDLQGTNHQLEFIPLPYFIGAYQVQKSQQYRFTNPKYIHANNLCPATDMDRADHCRFLASLGSWSSRDVGKTWNVSAEMVRKWTQTDTHTWGDYRRNGKRTFARTMQTIHEWEGVSYAELGRLFGIPRQTLNGWRKLITKPTPTRPRFHR